MNYELQIKLDRISTQLEDACKELVLSDEPLTIRVQLATAELEALHPKDFEGAPVWLKFDIDQLINLIGDQPTQDNAVAFASKLLDVYARTETLRSQNATGYPTPDRRPRVRQGPPFAPYRSAVYKPTRF
jgi:hypothetical protein